LEEIKFENCNISENNIISVELANVLGGHSEAAPTSAPTWMDGALIEFSFLSLCHPRLTFFVCPFSALSQP